MTAQEIRKAYLDFCAKRGHKIIPRALLVPQDDPTTLFTGSGMQPLIPYLLGEAHPDGQRLANSQTCLRAQDIEEVGDTSHTTFFEMLGNWSLGDYFKKEQIVWFAEFLFDVIKLDPSNVYVSCYIGNKKFNIPRDDEAIECWQAEFQKRGIEAKVIEIGSAEEGAKVGMQGGRIFLYDGNENWWSRAGNEEKTPVGEPCGPDSEVFYDFGAKLHDEKQWGKPHPASDSPRFMEIGNSVFMSYKRTDNGVSELPAKNIDFGGGLERIAAASINSPDVFKISLLWPIIEKLEEISGEKYEIHTDAMRVIADHIRGAVFLAVDGVAPSNKEQGYVMRRLIRRAIRFAFELGVEQDFLSEITEAVAKLYKDDYPEIAKKEKEIAEILAREEKLFRQTLRKGLREMEKRSGEGLSGREIFELYDTYGFPSEMLLEEARFREVKIDANWQKDFDDEMKKQRERSQTATKGIFKGGLTDHSDETKKLHTATHLMYQALRQVLGDHVVQRGSNVSAERTRFDFSHPEKMTKDQQAEVEKIVNEQIAKDLKVGWKEYSTDEAFKLGAKGAFGDKYGDKVKVYSMGEPGKEPFSIEICGGPHVEHTGQLAEGGKRFKITKEEASSAGVRRIKAVLQ
jgi:alanyl-tRNA synthetase